MLEHIILHYLNKTLNLILFKKQHDFRRISHVTPVNCVQIFMILQEQLTTHQLPMQ